jgi:hypothetical protein
MNQPKPFNKSREHFHVLILLILINFFFVSTIYFLHHYLQHTGLKLINGMLSLGALIFLFCSIYSRSNPLTKFSYMICMALTIYFFWG